ncbi:MFS general substrate transporter [Trametes versicolor FP-101664 SS1]|uniref:MFS general substrate transporter n=1 Tax=Trametes versicolor (strain FP-101664) TaxID=717944 RepID=UPI000462189E|nr:MFS general substrate transporter [Trametes versicolor FP-101664 SS1]EIW55079.1 MFS general substrate transporter [Trametes versicolor FP-101664 SS1]
MSEVELSNMHSRVPHLPHDPTTPAATAVDEGKEVEYVETNAAANSEQPSRAQSTTFPATTPAMKLKARIQFATLCWSLFMAGWNDGTTGPLLPRIQSVYHVGFAVVSLIFVFNCVGFVTGAAANVWLTDRLGFGTVMVIGAFAQVVGYSLEAPAPPFPVFVLGYAINGFGLSLQDAGANGFVASLKDNAATKMGILHAVYGVGALSSPLVATQFSQITHWSFHYLVSLGIALSNVIVLIAVFRFKDQDTCLAEIGQTPSHDEQSTTNSKYTQIFGLRALHLLAFFILIYVGVEVTLGGWIVTYVIQLRGGGPSSGYISSGFFGGLTLGRVGLLWVNQKIGEQRAICVYGILAIALELVIWLVPSLIGGGIAVSFVGVLLGPIYPIVMNHAARVLPPWLLTGCIGWIAGFGQAGSALLPFLTGALASRVGIKSLQPLLVSMMGFMVFLWALVPRTPRRVD